MQESPDSRFLCAICGRPTLMCCSACKSVFYCSEAHQIQHWEAHAADCIYSEPPSTEFDQESLASENKTDLESVPDNSLLADDEIYQIRYTIRKDIVTLLCQNQNNEAVNKSRNYFTRVLAEYERNRFFDIYELLADGLLLAKSYISSGELEEARQILMQLYARMCTNSTTHNAQPAGEFLVDESKGQKASLTYVQLKKKIGVYSTLAALFSTCGDLTTTEKMYVQYIKCVEVHIGPDTLEASNCYFMVALFYQSIKQLDKAVACTKRALELRSEHLNDTHETVADCHYNLGLLYKQQGNAFKAMTQLNRALQIREANASRTSLPVAQVLEVIGRMLMKKRDYKAAFIKLSECYSIRKQLLRHCPNHEELNRVGALLQELQDSVRQEQEMQRPIAGDFRGSPFEESAIIFRADELENTQCKFFLGSGHDFYSLLWRRQLLQI